MALWQFTTFTVLIAVLIAVLSVYAIIITRRLGLADARLTRMEEALLFLVRSGSVNAGGAVSSVGVDTPVAAEARPVISEIFESPGARALVPELPQVSAKPRVSAQEEARRVYLTMRDLRAQGEQRATGTLAPDSDALHAEALEEVARTNELIAAAYAASASADALDTPTTSSEPAEAPLPTNSDGQPVEAQPPANSEPAVSLPAAAMLSGSDSLPAATTLSETESLPATTTLSEAAAATILETGDASVTNTESQNSAEPDQRPPDDDASVETDDDAAASKKNQETLVFLNAQRRRRRAHLGY